VRWLGAVVATVLLAAGCSSDPEHGPSTTPAFPTTVPPSTPAVAPQGFKAVLIRVTKPDGTTQAYCVWVADTELDRERGLMQVTGLGGAAGMLFRFGADQSSAFWMKDTVIPLSIAFFKKGGAYVSSTDMEPCPPTAPGCPTYSATAAYADAIEVPKGQLASLGIGPGSRLAVTQTSCAPSG
jgi:uncharacterized membrane protein (UPF0127 family)